MRFVTVSDLLGTPDAIPEATRPSRMGYRMRLKHGGRAAKHPGAEPAEAAPPATKEGDEHAHPPT